MSQKQSTSACTRIRIHSEIGKENKLTFQKSYNLLICTINIKPDTPINVYTQFCLNTAKSKFSLISPVADW